MVISGLRSFWSTCRWKVGAHRYQSVGHFCPRFLHRLFRNSLYIAPVVGTSGEVARYRFGVVCCSDGDELPDVIFDAAIWIFSVLFAWGGSRRGEDHRHLQGCATIYWDSTDCPHRCGDVPRSGDVAVIVIAM